MSLHAKLKKLEDKAMAKGEHAVAAAAAHLVQDIDSMDRQINLVGALHEVGYLQNSLKPYWNAFRADEPAWIERCLTRLLTADHDYWALAALLGCDGPATIGIAMGKGFKSAATRQYERFDKPDVHVDTLYFSGMGKVLHPILEVGHDTREMINIDVGRARALSLENQQWQPGEPLGTGGLSLSMQAKLPHGAWRSVWTPFTTQEAGGLT
ncbi:hypothetical protein CSQ93_02450 [Janthinobacterium sp. BJB426]|uniref:hypothetical protein n=1 Tax=Janthinobacterium sp. BJB426 TaxID=2048010 RepID=UPI000C1031A8|nr:hypothetical protein [Janthinobacterium sp. BJB426]PHV30003.1 hypothetical protein CSQ93_02450 [Janthinobacterium sp. BJB426]